MKHKPLIIFVMALYVYALPVWGYQASSSNYRLERDSINAGGELSTSTSYSLEDTAGEPGKGASSSAIYNLKAGYQQIEDSSIISITAPSNINLSPNIGESGGTADGYAEWTVTTGDSAGYTLRIEASTNPAMQTTEEVSFANYTPGGGVPDYAWSVTASEKEFGFTPEGIDITSTYKDNGANTCGVGSSDTASACWDSVLTSTKLIASTSTPNSSFGGTITRVRFKAEAGDNSNPTQGSYVATITLTAVTQ